MAFYYYNTDLRDQDGVEQLHGRARGDVCGTTDKFLKQNMVTFTIGLGVNGTLKYDKNYTSQNTPGSGDFYDLKIGNKNWPIPNDQQLARTTPRTSTTCGMRRSTAPTSAPSPFRWPSPTSSTSAPTTPPS